MKKDLLKLSTVAVAVGTLGIGSGVFAVQPSNIEEIRCSNNGNGNGNEEFEFVAVGVPAEQECVKFIENGGDEPGQPGNDIDLDPNTGKPHGSNG